MIRDARDVLCRLTPRTTSLIVFRHRHVEAKYRTHATTLFNQYGGSVRWIRKLERARDKEGGRRRQILRKVS